MKQNTIIRGTLLVALLITLTTTLFISCTVTSDRTPLVGVNDSLSESSNIDSPALTAETTNADVLAKNEAMRSFIGVDMNGRDISENEYITALTDAGIYSFGSDKLFWLDVEKSPTSGYNPEYPDDIVRKIEMVKGDLCFTLYNVSTWATEVPSERNPASAAKSNYKNRYFRYVRAFAERYDKDGKHDMPGLKYAHNYFQIEDEQALSGWIGTAECEYLSKTGDEDATYRCLAEAYGEHLKTAYEAIKSANPLAKVITIAFNPGDFFDVNPALTDIPLRGRLIFLDMLIKQYNEYFDFLGLNFNYDYVSIHGMTRFLDQRWGGYDIKYMVADAGTMPNLFRDQFVKDELYIDRYPFKTGSDILAILDTGTGHSEYAEIKNWWEGEKAKLSFKKAVVAADAGAEQIYFQFCYAAGAAQNAWSHSGILSLGLELEDDGIKGTPRPLVFALGQLNDRVGSFNEVKNIHPLPPGINPRDWIWAYSYRGDTGLTEYIVWSGGDATTINLRRSIPSLPEYVIVTPIVTTMDALYMPIYPHSDIKPSTAIEIDDTPVFIEVSATE
jgi:hypothetical protein